MPQIKCLLGQIPKFFPTFFVSTTSPGGYYSTTGTIIEPDRVSISLTGPVSTELAHDAPPHHENRAGPNYIILDLAHSFSLSQNLEKICFVIRLRNFGTNTCFRSQLSDKDDLTHGPLQWFMPDLILTSITVHLVSLFMPNSLSHDCEYGQSIIFFHNLLEINFQNIQWKFPIDWNTHF